VLIIRDAGDRRDPVLYELRHGRGTMESQVELERHPDRWKSELFVRITFDPWSWATFAASSASSGCRAAYTASRAAALVQDARTADFHDDAANSARLVIEYIEYIRKLYGN